MVDLDSDHTSSSSSSEESSDESEDPDSRDPEFVKTIQQFHRDGNLRDLVVQSYDTERNPLLSTTNNGVIRSVNVQLLQREFPEIFKRLIKVRKRHGSFVYLNNFLQNYYKDEEGFLHEKGTSKRLSQIEYILIAIMYLEDNNQ